MVMHPPEKTAALFKHVSAEKTCKFVFDKESKNRPLPSVSWVKNPAGFSKRTL